MRALHGASLLENFIRRCTETDIMVFDITGSNPNVMFELGLAMALKGPSCGNIFVFQETTPNDGEPIDKPPSDLAGYFFTRYHRLKSRAGTQYGLNDQSGFRAALRTRIVAAAREKDMWQDIRGVEDDDPGGDRPG